MQAAIDGVNEVQVGVFSSFITTVCVLGPLAFITGDIGKVLASIPIMLILVLAVSLIEAYAILPSHLGHSLHHDDPDNPSKLRSTFDKWFDGFRDHWFGGLLDRAIQWRYLLVGSVIGLMLASTALVAGGLVGFAVFPAQEGDTLAAKLTLPSRHTAGSYGSHREASRSGTRGGRSGVVSATERGAATYRVIQHRIREKQRGLRKRPALSRRLMWIYWDRNKGIPGSTKSLPNGRRKSARLPDLLAFSVDQPSLGPAGRAIEVPHQGGPTWIK